MAALGQTQTLSPSSANTPVSARNISNENRMSIYLNLDRNDLLHDDVADQLEEDGDTRHLIARGIFNKELDIFPVGIEHQERHRDGNDGQGRGRDAAVSADGLDSAAQLEPLADDNRQLIEQLGKITACPLLQQHGGDEKVHFQQWHALGKILQRVLERQAQVLFVECAPELTRQRVGELAMNHFERNREGVAGAHRTRHELQTVWKLLFKFLQPRLSLAHDP